MRTAKRLFFILRNKYIIVTLAFIIWMLFFDLKDWRLMSHKTQKLKGLKQSEKILTAQINETRKELNLLRTDAGSIEKYAREKFYMKKDNEDLFIMKTP